MNWIGSIRDTVLRIHPSASIVRGADGCSVVKWIGQREVHLSKPFEQEIDAWLDALVRDSTRA